MLTWMMLSATVQAGEISFAEPEEVPVAEESSASPEAHLVDMDAYYRRMRTAKTGIWVGAGGLTVATVGVTTMLVGFELQDDGLIVAGTGIYALGGLGYLAGAPIMNGGAMAAARSLNSGGVPVKTWSGGLSWGLMGGGFALSTVGSLLLQPGLTSLGGLAFLGSYALAGVQMGFNSTRKPNGTQVSIWVEPGRNTLNVAARF
ncbi:MAG: hypothetical protein KC912_21930 [Proteobacteria bacterium]|nr:hypothetical protein [Pseudomonadota bacterium]